ncbi:Do family serine endopeptidase [Parachitinimonas caeni]|uniref:Do family serine endopeptidase n=1 Tax=Parachitinimonas caeni TaxID=3031301 RepID=A0ABT7DSV1_9NEIS|nr:Do family serine endopeptidase [Parachitinimonas caeni]MDK2123138.1 Do family serine endopeptidase [Parachitinimonas caeni]
MKKLWLIFAQTTTAGLAIWFLVTLLKPSWLPRPTSEIVTLKEQSYPSSKAPIANSYRDGVKRAIPSVVNIYSSKVVRTPRHPLLDDPFFRRFFGERPEQNDSQQSSSLGSGVVVSPQGYIITNNHVVESADEIEVALADGRTTEGKVIGSDPETDLAVIKIDLPDIPSIQFGHPEQLQVGDVVLAIGNPFGVGQTVTMGIVSALGRSQLGINTFENFIQTDAAINPGNSGGALIDSTGNLIGINSAIYSKSGGSMGIGFAIPATTVRQVMEQLIQDGSVTRGWLGVEPQDMTPDIANSLKLNAGQQGVLVTGVVRDSPADSAGIKPGDVLTEIAGRKIQDSTEMLNVIASLPPNKIASLKIIRDKRLLSINVTIGKRPRIQAQ